MPQSKRVQKARRVLLSCAVVASIVTTNSTTKAIAAPIAPSAPSAPVHTGNSFAANQHPNPTIIDVGSKNSINGLIINRGQTAVLDFTGSGTLNVLGNLINHGTLYVVSSNPLNTTASLTALNIINTTGATLTSVLPNGGLSGVGQLDTQLSLSLLAINNLSNRGIISSSGLLSLTAGTGITNGITSHNITGTISNATIQSAGALSMQAPQITNAGQIIAGSQGLLAITNSLRNSNLIQAVGGSLAIRNLNGNALFVDNTHGQLLAGQNLNFGITTNSAPGQASQQNSSALLQVIGGHLAGSSVNANALCGKVVIDATQIDGPVNATSGIASITAHSGNLTTGRLKTSADPVTVLTGGGTLYLSPFDSGGSPADFIALSEGSIAGAATAGPNPAINTYGGQLVFSAGYKFTGSNSSCTNCTGNWSLQNVPSGYVGNIDLSGWQLNGSAPYGNFTAQASNKITLGTIGFPTNASAGPTLILNAGTINITSIGSSTTGIVNLGGSMPPNVNVSGVISISAISTTPTTTVITPNVPAPLPAAALPPQPQTPKVTTDVASANQPHVPTFDLTVTFNSPTTASIIPTDTTRNTGAPTAKNQLTIDNSDKSFQLNNKQLIDVPIAFFDGTKFDSEATSKLANDGTVVSSVIADNHLMLDSGNVLFAPKTDMQISTPQGEVFVAAGSIALVLVTPQGVAVLDLVDGQSGDVKVHSGKTTLALVPGQQAVISNQTGASFDQSNPGSVIGYRELTSTDAGNGKTVFVAEFSPLGALSLTQLRTVILHSKGSGMRALADKLLKEAVVLQIATANHGAYTRNSSGNP